MSLDVYLTVPGEVEEAPTAGRIFIRRNGQTVEITRDEWDELYPGREPTVATEDLWGGYVYEANITHNLVRMADAAGVYEALWQPEEIGVKRAAQLIDPLRDGLATLNADPDHFKQFNPENGWGDYDGLVRFVAGYLTACERWPQAEVRVSR
jgi:hypothetical protein